jgi:PAS fold
VRAHARRNGHQLTTGLETYLKMIEEEDRDKAVSDLKAALAKGGPFTTECRIRRPPRIPTEADVASVAASRRNGELERFEPLLHPLSHLLTNGVVGRVVAK